MGLFENGLPEEDRELKLAEDGLLSKVPQRYKWDLKREWKLWLGCVIFTFSPYIFIKDMDFEGVDQKIAEDSSVMYSMSRFDIKKEDADIEKRNKDGQDYSDGIYVEDKLEVGSKEYLELQELYAKAEKDEDIKEVYIDLVKAKFIPILDEKVKIIPGENLIALATRLYGDPNSWTCILLKNRHTVQDPFNLDPQKDIVYVTPNNILTEVHTSEAWLSHYQEVMNLRPKDQQYKMKVTMAIASLHPKVGNKLLSGGTEKDLKVDDFKLFNSRKRVVIARYKEGADSDSSYSLKSALRKKSTKSTKRRKV